MVALEVITLTIVALEVITLIIVALEVTLILARPCARVRNTAIPTRAVRIAPPASIVSSSTEVTLVNLVIMVALVAPALPSPTCNMPTTNVCKR